MLPHEGTLIVMAGMNRRPVRCMHQPMEGRLSSLVYQQVKKMERR
ncbi:hypothetical protein HMPREF3038_03006 [Akkermansia sp. KLE1797]|nr:hypothetical protein HMPREF3038_03006 [Akkermansia sp. KLE1797]KXU53743.1 hypothetical protein HMPREF3039_02079 [Akkermansia sp. KLE1798]KZA03516.1 hypothetical protein HMPREF1326_02817 [Akkermansia sp. KLE1605]